MLARVCLGFFLNGKNSHRSRVLGVKKLPESETNFWRNFFLQSGIRNQKLVMDGS